MAGVDRNLSRRIEAAHRRLNADDVLPALAHRRNAAVYPLVGYVNHVIGCYLSGNFAAIPLFIERARQHMAASPAVPRTETYYTEVAADLDMIEAVLRLTSRR